MNSISALKKSAAAIALVLGVTPMGAHAWLADAKMVAHFPLNVKDQPGANQTPDATKKCVGTVVGTVTFGPTGNGGSDPAPESFYEWIPGNDETDRATKVAMFPGTADVNITVADKLPATCTGIAAMSTAPAYSISAWVKTDNNPPSGASIIDRGTSLALTVGPTKDVNPDTGTQNVHPVTFCVTGAGTTLMPGSPTATPNPVLTKCLTANMWADTNTDPGQGVWHNIIVTYNKAPPAVNGVPQSQAVMYIDGYKVATSEPPDPVKKHTAPFPSPAASTSTRIGNKFKGYIDDVRFYSAALTPDDIHELSMGCRPATFDPKTGKLSIPCVVEYMVADGPSLINGAWTADLLALPPTKSVGSGYVTVGGEVARNVVFNVASAKPLPVPVGSPPALPTGYVQTGTTPSMPGGEVDNTWSALFQPSEYPWGRFMAGYGYTPWGRGTVAMDDWIDEYDDIGGNYGEHTPADLYIPGVIVPSPFGLPVKECYSATLYYALNYNRFYMDYSDVSYEGINCSYMSGLVPSGAPAAVTEEASAAPAAVETADGPAEGPGEVGTP